MYINSKISLDMYTVSIYYSLKNWDASLTGPWNAIRPPATRIVWWNISVIPEAGWWIEQTTALPALAKSLNCSTTEAAAQLSNPVVGSSQNNSGGSFIICKNVLFWNNFLQ